MVSLTCFYVSVGSDRFEELSLSDQSVLIPQEEAAAESWEDLKNVSHVIIPIKSCDSNPLCVCILQELVQLNELVAILAAKVKVSWDGDGGTGDVMVLLGM